MKIFGAKNKRWGLWITGDGISVRVPHAQFGVFVRCRELTPNETGVFIMWKERPHQVEGKPWFLHERFYGWPENYVADYS